ncbi:hypothetical protein BVIET440_340002 [Burkholderia vietnamiensis]
MVNMNPLHGGAIVRAASWPALARRCLPLTRARPGGGCARCCAAPRQTATRVQPGGFHDKRSNLPITYAAVRSTHVHCVADGRFTLLQTRPYNPN